MRNQNFGGVMPTVLGLAVCALLAGNAHASERNVTITRPVSTEGLNLNKPEDARELYTRLRHAAEFVCGHTDRVDVAPDPLPKQCYEKALAEAVRKAHAPLLTQAYLGTHTIEEATARGIEVPSQMASR